MWPVFARSGVPWVTICTLPKKSVLQGWHCDSASSLVPLCPAWPRGAPVAPLHPCSCTVPVSSCGEMASSHPQCLLTQLGFTSCLARCLSRAKLLHVWYAWVSVELGRVKDETTQGPWGMWKGSHFWCPPGAVFLGGMEQPSWHMGARPEMQKSHIF